MDLVNRSDSTLLLAVLAQWIPDPEVLGQPPPSMVIASSCGPVTLWAPLARVDVAELTDPLHGSLQVFFKFFVKYTIPYV